MDLCTIAQDLHPIIFKYLHGDDLRFLYGVCKILKELAYNELKRRAGGEEPRLAYTTAALFVSQELLEKNPTVLRIYDKRIFVAYGNVKTFEYVRRLMGSHDYFRYACVCGYLLLAKYIDLHHPSPISKNWVFYLACFNLHFDIAKWLYDSYADQIQIEEIGISYGDVLEQPSIFGREEFVKWLCEIFAFSTDQKIKSLQRACFYGHLESVKMITVDLEIDQTLKDQMFQTACCHNNTEVAKYLYQKYNLVNSKSLISYNYILICVCEHGYMKTLKYITTLIQLEELADQSKARAFDKACSSGHVEVLKYLIRYIDPTIISDKKRTDIFKVACERGYADIVGILSDLYVYPMDTIRTGFQRACGKSELGVIKMLHKKHELTMEVVKNGLVSLRPIEISMVKELHAMFNFSVEDIRINHNWVLRKSFDYGNLELAKWLRATFNMTIDDIRSMGNYALRSACCNIGLEAVEWICETFNLTKDDITYGEGGVIDNTCETGYVDILEYFHKKYELNRPPHRILVTACINNNLGVVQWLCETFEVSAEEFNEEEIDNLCNNDTIKVLSYLFKKYRPYFDDIVLMNACRQHY